MVNDICKVSFMAHQKRLRVGPARGKLSRANVAESSCSAKMPPALSSRRGRPCLVFHCSVVFSKEIRGCTPEAAAFPNRARIPRDAQCISSSGPSFRFLLRTADQSYAAGCAEAAMFCTATSPKPRIRNGVTLRMRSATRCSVASLRVLPAGLSRLRRGPRSTSFVCDKLFLEGLFGHHLEAGSGASGFLLPLRWTWTRARCHSAVHLLWLASWSPFSSYVGLPSVTAGWKPGLLLPVVL